MKLSKIEIAGFRGVRDPLELDLSTGFTVISGRNGAGKSTLCDAIEYVLTGCIHGGQDHSEDRESYKDYIPWKRGEDDLPEGTYVTLTLTDGEGHSMIVRREWENGLHVQSSLGFDAPGDSSATDQLRQMLCVASESPEDPLSRLCKTSILRDEVITKHSVEAKERDRYKFVSHGLGTDVFPDTIARASDLHGELKERRDDLKADLETKKAEVGRLEDNIKSLKKDAEAINDLDTAVRVVQDYLVEHTEL